MRSTDLRKKIDKIMTRREFLYESLSELRERKIFLEERHSNAIKAREVINLVAQDIQHNIEEGIGNIVSMALESVLDDPYKFKVEFVKRRNKTECDLFVESNGERMHPSDSIEGGALDIIGLALRLPFVLMSNSRKILILDEPMKFLSRNFQPKAAQMLKELSDKLKIQMIVSSHIPELIDTADKIFQIRKGELYGK